MHSARMGSLTPAPSVAMAVRGTREDTEGASRYNPPAEVGENRVAEQGDGALRDAMEGDQRRKNSPRR